MSRFLVVQAYRDSLRISFRTGHNTCPNAVPILTRALSTVNNLPNTKTPNNSSSANETLSLLHRAITLLPRAFNAGSTRAEGTADFWNAILCNVHEDLSATTERPAKIVGSCTPIVFLLTGALIFYLPPVCGLDKWSNTKELVTGLLVDPYSTTGPQSDSLNNRWNDASRERVDIT